MKRRAFALISGLVAAALGLSVVFAAVGDHVSSEDFSLAGANGDPLGITWDGSKFRVVDDGDDWIYAYSSSGTYISGDSFSLAAANDDPTGITWDGSYLRVTDDVDGKVYTYTSSGTHASSQDFALSNGDPQGITWDGIYLRVVDRAADRVYTYTSSGTYTSGEDFDLATGNDYPYGIAWDGVYLRVTDDDKVYTYTSSGTHTSGEDFDLATGHQYPYGIAWDGVYLRVVEWHSGNKVFTYEGLPTGPFVNYGLSEDVDYAGAVSSVVVAYGGWKCVRSQAGVAMRINNASLTVHGFCAQNKDTDGMEVEIHLSATTTAEYADLKRFADVTGIWWLVEAGGPAMSGQKIYDDEPITATSSPALGSIGFTETSGGLEASDRLGFSTLAKVIDDSDCTEAASGGGFACDRTHLFRLKAGDDAGVLLFSLTEANTITTADTPATPRSLTVSRSTDYGEATLKWELYDAATRYEIARLTAVQVSVVAASRIEYGDPVTYIVTGTQAGVDEHTDSTVEAQRTYQYRIRARGADGDSWSGWSDYAYTGAKPGVDIAPPGNLELDRDADSVIASWSAPTGDFDNYTLQRQELVIVEGSTFFANVVTLGGASWLPATSTMYMDTHIIPSQTYEYRIAAVKDDQVGTYSDWFRVAPPLTSLGGSPSNFQFLSTGQRLLDDRREFWMGWDAVPGADDYEVQLLVYDVATGGQNMEKYVVTDPTYFQTSWGRVGIRVRGRKLDADICGSNPDNHCLTEWSGWYEVRFTPTVTIDSPDLVDDTSDTSITTLREDTEDLFEAVLSPAGATVDGGQVIQFGVVLTALVVAGMSVALSWRRGMAPLGVGMGATIFILILFTGYRLYGTPLAWPVAAQALVAAAGLYALVRQTGVFR